MTEAEKHSMLKAMTGETDGAVLSTYLSLAAGKVLRRAYPYRNDVKQVPERYACTQLEIAAYLLNKRGAEGQTAHSENGISRSYEDGDVPPSLLREIVTCAAVFTGEEDNMKTMERNKQSFWYLLFDHKEPLLDEDGSDTGDCRVIYREAVQDRANISPATGAAQAEQFGSLTDYDKVIVTDDLSCPIDEHTVLFVDKAPEYDGEGSPLYDYEVRRVARSLSSISYAISKVSVS